MKGDANNVVMGFGTFFLVVFMIGFGWGNQLGTLQ